MSWLMPCLQSVRLKMYRHLIDMNANELADKLEDALDTDSWCQECGLETTEPVARQAATMLRQQQVEIEALKMMLANRNDALDKLDLK
jgi:hypothetical protein